MDYRQLGRSGLRVSKICLGTMMFGGRTDAAASNAIMARAREQGINFLDTADAYNKGDSERVIGAAIAAERDEWVVASKAANPMGEGPNERGLSRKWLMQACEASLSRLATDYIDIYYLHKEDLETPLEETLRALGDLIRQGKIRYFGALQLPGLAGGRDLPALRRFRPGPAGGEPALLQRPEPHAGGGAPAGLRPLRARRGALQPAGPRRADRQIRAGRRAARRHPRRAGRTSA